MTSWALVALVNVGNRTSSVILYNSSCGALEVWWPTSGWSWTSLSQPLVVRNSLKWTMNKNPYLFWEAYGHRSCYWRSGWRLEELCGPNQCGTSKQGFPWRRCLDPWQSLHLLLSKGHFCYKPRRTGESTNLYMDASLSVLNLVIVKERK